MSIFKAYDIRGKYPEEFNEEIISKIALACINIYKPKKILIGNDGRIGSKSLANKLINTFISYGINVYYLGMVSSSTFNFAINNGKFDLCFQITASHNPKEYNGIKIYDKYRNLIGYENGLNKIEKKIKKIKIKSLNNRKGKIKDVSFYKNKHLKFLKEKIKFKNLKFAVDFSNGVGAIVFSDLIKNERCICLNEKIDGNFPSHIPEPNKESLVELSKIILKNKLDFGIAFDGDADRIVFLDEMGNIIDGELISFILAKHLKPKKFIYDVSFSEFFINELEKRKIRGIEASVGRMLINLLKKSKADIGAERSNHFYFKDCNYLEDAFYTFIIIANILYKENKKISELYIEYPKIINENYKITINENLRNKLMKKIIKYSKKFKTKNIDGVKIILDDLSTCLIRPSNTEPIIRISTSTTKENLIKVKNIIDEIKQIIEKEKI